jgi:hypothetical protein
MMRADVLAETAIVIGCIGLAVLYIEARLDAHTKKILDALKDRP